MKQRLYTSISGFALKCAFVITLLIGFNSWSQTDPVQATITTSPPFLNYLSYYGDQNNHLQITLTNLDFATPPILARLRIRIQGSGWQVYTNPNATIGQPFLLEAGMPVTISGIELLPYLQANNLINPNGVDLNNLPQGWTDICVDVIRVSASQQVLATNSCGFATIQNVQPPTPFLPTCGSRLDTTSMFENFQWFASNPPAVGMGIETQYDLNIYHWYDTTNFSPAAWAYNPVYFEPNINFGESFVVPMNQIPFVQGGKYVWTVTARVLVNNIVKNVITNNGVSAPCIFYYGEEQSLNEMLADGLEIELFTQPSSPQKGKAWWTVTDYTPNQGLSNFDQFYVEYRKQPTGNEGFEIPWFHKTLTSLEHFMYQLEPSTTYEVKVSGIIGGVVGDPTPVETFTTLAPRVYNCGESDLPFLPTNYTPLANTTVGTQVQIGQFMMTMTQVNPLGQTGHYAGKGEIPIAFLMGAKAKVTFSDILIDTEFRVREGRVDVITEGLESWLDDQMQQFIDPYYVDGTIDSAYVQDSLAWVVVDGVPQSFVFDPPHYPIIVNDASGNQYTIYPNGLIVVGTYLSVSETWAVAENETVRFGQSDTEIRGFDPKEHQEWHENYETMKLLDNTFYYVANKSLAKSEGDKVNVQFPTNVSHVRFELANGDTIPYVDLEGAWMGDKPYLDSGLAKTLYLPSFSSGGKYELYAIVDGVKSGQLNIQVYNEKSKDVIVVPLVSSVPFSATDIQNELKRTLGEANITVNVTLEAPWVDTTGTFTATSNISLPTEVGLLTKYSDDMRDLRDAYFEQHPNAPKNKYYLFLVNGFDSPSELGYMVRGRSMGFVKVSSNQAQVLQTISHELGHGMGALEHTFKDNGIAQGSTSNLMDYSGADNLTIAQWKELRDLDLVPSLYDVVEDGLFGFDEYVNFYQDIKTRVPIVSNNKNDAFYLLNGQPYKFQPSGTKSIRRVIFDRLGRVYAFETDDFEYYEAIITRTAGAEVPLCRAYLTIPQMDVYYSLSNSTGYISSSQLDFLSENGYPFLMPSTTDSVYSQSCLFLHNGQAGSAFNIEIFENCLVERTVLIESLPNQEIFDKPALNLPPSFTDNNYTILNGGNCTLPSNIGSLDQNGYGADIYYKLREDAPDQTQLINLATYFSQLASNYLYIFYDEETNAYEYIGPSDSDPNVQHRDLTLMPEVFKRESIYSISAFNLKFPRNTWFNARGRDSIISARNIRSNLVGYYNANTIDYTTFDIPSFKDWAADSESNLEEIVDYIEDLYDDVVFANPTYASNQNMQNTVQWIANVRNNYSLALANKLHLRHNVIAILNTLGAFDRYEYSIVDLVEREGYILSGGESMLIAIYSNESNGMGRPINISESYTQYVNRFETESAFFLGFGYMKMYIDNFFEPVALMNVIQKAQAVRSAFKSHKGSYQKNLDDLFKGQNNSGNNWFDMTSFKNSTAKTPGVDNGSLTNLPKSFFDDAYKAVPENGSVLHSKVQNVVTNGDLSGKITEEIVEDIMKANGFKVGNGRYYGDYETARNGLDGFFYKGDITNPTEIIVIDSKQMNTNGSVKLNSGNQSTGLPVQMKEDWIRYIADEKLNNLTGLQKQTATAIQESPIGFIQKYVAAIDKANGSINFLKLGNF